MMLAGFYNESISFTDNIDQCFAFMYRKAAFNRGCCQRIIKVHALHNPEAIGYVELFDLLTESKLQIRYKQ